MLYTVIKSDFQFFSAPENAGFKEQFSFMWRNNFSWVKENPHKITFLNMYYITMSIPLERRIAAKKNSIIELYKMVAKGKAGSQTAGEHVNILVESIYAQFISTALMIHLQSEISPDDCIEESLQVMLRIMNV